MKEERATHLANAVWEEWQECSSEITNGMLDKTKFDKSNPFVAYKFASGRVWTSQEGWLVYESNSSAVTNKPISILEEATSIIYGDREKTYGDPAKNLRHIAEQWTLHLQQQFGIDIKLSIEDVCWMMVELKKCRQINETKRDNLVDAVGYIALIERTSS